jgi:coiled-coil domain-containing protein 12
LSIGWCADTVDIATLAPRKVTWDLERDLAKKMGKLERRTDRAIAELVARRLKEAGDGEVAMDQLIAAEEQADQLENQDSDADE